MSSSAPTATAPAPQAGPLVEILKIAAPSVATMTSYTLMQFVDGLMVSHIQPADAANMAAQFNGGMSAWLAMSVVAGLLSVVNTYVSQNLGAGHPERGPAYAWNALWVCALVALLMVPYSRLLPSMFAWMGHEGPLIALETGYARILCYGAFLSMATRGLAQYFYGLHRPVIVLTAAVAGNVVNFALNYTFVLGHFGAPALGLTGSAMSTVIGTGVELLFPLCVFLGPASHRLYGTRSAWRPSWTHLRDILRIGWPGALMFGNEMVCWAYFMIGLVGHFGVVHNSAGAIALRYMHLSFMPAVGISFAMTAIVGRYLGMGRPDLARGRARLGILLTMTYMGACAIAFVALREPMINAFIDGGMAPDQRARILDIGVKVMLLAALFQLFDALGITIIGVLRGAGDTVWPGVATVILAWSCLIGLGQAMVRYADGLGSIGPWIGATAYIILLGVFLLYRYVGGHWLTIHLLRPPVAPQGEPLTAPVPLTADA